MELRVISFSSRFTLVDNFAVDTSYIAVTPNSHPEICGVSNSSFVLVKPDSVRFHHDIILCLKSDSIVVSFS